MEIQVGLRKKKGESKDNPSQYQSHTSELPTPGYDLYKYWGEEEKDNTDFTFQEDDAGGDKYMPYAWTMCELF